MVSKKDKVQDSNINQLKLKVHDTYKKDETIKTNFDPTNDLDVINKSYLDEKIFRTNGHLSFLETTSLNYNATNNLWNKF